MGAPQYEQAGADIGGTGTTNTIPRWTGPSTLGDSIITQSGTNRIGVTGAIWCDVSGGVSGVAFGMTETAAIRQTGTNATMYFDASTTGGNGQFIWRSGNSYTERARIDSAGNFGIGTPSPGARLDVSDTANQLRATVSNATPAVTTYALGLREGYISARQENSGSFNVFTDLVSSTSQFTPSGIRFFTHASGDASISERWRINSPGHLLAGADNSYDIGASGATRPRTVYVGTSVIVGPGATAAGTNANAFGASCTASGAGAVAAGISCTAAATGSVALGSGSTCSAAGGYSIAIGADCVTAGGFSLGTGWYGNTYLHGQRAHSAGRFAATGDAQVSTLIARVQTSNATPTNAWLNGSSARLVIPNSYAWAADVHIVARSATGAGHAYFVRRVLIKRDANAASTAIVGTVQTIGTDIGSNAGAPPAGWAVAITADTTNGALDLQVTGALATTINWVARVELVEVSLA